MGKLLSYVLDSRIAFFFVFTSLIVLLAFRESEKHFRSLATRVDQNEPKNIFPLVQLGGERDDMSVGRTRALNSKLLRWGKHLLKATHIFLFHLSLTIQPILSPEKRLRFQPSSPGLEEEASARVKFHIVWLSCSSAVEAGRSTFNTPDDAWKRGTWSIWKIIWEANPIAKYFFASFIAQLTSALQKGRK